ncbi:phosphoenolpyruvate carboxykinase (GTP) [Bacilliculturomica massiliensis]|uniref:phosphoenolpyruvate carboxykinase (GTP) n=1 Tax=Bacilliculturomica massiliensis TaxID=1917867 RepID=UPI002482AB34|nr:phosphoenolpyruvate carboxykinase (GTP) [Bacilliculturomica massiliensis]
MCPDTGKAEAGHRGRKRLNAEENERVHFKEENKMTINNQAVETWIGEMAEMTRPDRIVYIDGSKEQIEELRELAVRTGEMIRLNQELLPDCYYYRTSPKDVARDEKRTLICTKTREEAGPTNNWTDPQEMYAKMKKLYQGCMKGRTMYVIPFSMGVPGSPFAKIGIELTDSVYVVLNMCIMTRVGAGAVRLLEEGADFTRCLHSKADLNENEKYIVHFPEDNAIWSINSAYGGNVLLGKKCLALRIASFMGRNEGWMAEHMLILGIENPQGEVKYICAAFPSACGKTNLAMLIPPELYRKQGYKVWTVGDDIAWLRVGEDGRLWAVNPENGFFGVAPGTNDRSNPNALATTKRGTIFTNVARNLDNNTVWWERLDKEPLVNGEDWLGRPWNGRESEEKGAHPNSRFTAPAENCPCVSSEFNSLTGVPISAIVFGGRRAKTEPLVYEARNWNHGVFMGASMSSETTAAANGAVGVVRHDPMAMLPFCGYNMADYFRHWLEMGRQVTDPPKFFHVNWFRTDEEGAFIWPGFGENLRVLLWMLDRCEHKVSAVKSPIGFQPDPRDIDLTGLDIAPETMKKLLSINLDIWKDEAAGIETFFSQFPDLPKELAEELTTLKKNLLIPTANPRNASSSIAV